MKNEMWLIWKDNIERRRYVIGTLLYENGKYYFKYFQSEIKDAINKGFKFFPGFENLSKTYESETLFSNIATRLPNINRPDYLEILNSYNLEKTSTQMDILKATTGRLITDNYEFVQVFDKNKIES